LHLKLDTLFPQHFDFCASLCIQVLPLVKLAFEVGVGTLDLVVRLLQFGVFGLCAFQLE